MSIGGNRKRKALCVSMLSAALMIAFWVDMNRARDEKKPIFFWFINEEQGEIVPDADDFPATAGQQSQQKLYRDGVYTASSGTPWGNVSIQLTVSNGAWSGITYVAIPQSPPSKYATKTLVQQALTVQSDRIAGVSGATYMTKGFQADLRSIIAQAKK